MWSLCLQMSLQRATFMLSSERRAGRKALYDVWSLETVPRIYARAQLLLEMWCCQGQGCNSLSQIMWSTIFCVAIKKIILLIGGHHKGHLNKQYKVCIRAVCDSFSTLCTEQREGMLKSWCDSRSGTGTAALIWMIIMLKNPLWKIVFLLSSLFCF